MFVQITNTQVSVDKALRGQPYSEITTSKTKKIISIPYNNLLLSYVCNVQRYEKHYFFLYDRKTQLIDKFLIDILQYDDGFYRLKQNSIGRVISKFDTVEHCFEYLKSVNYENVDIIERLYNLAKQVGW